MLIKDPVLAQAVREQARILANLRLRPDSFRVAVVDQPTETRRPPAVAARSTPLSAHTHSLAREARVFSTKARRTFSTTSAADKALAHVVSAAQEPHFPPARKFSPEGAAAARAKEPRSKAADAVVQGRRRGRTLKSLSLDGKLCAVLHPDNSIALTLAATFLEAGANDIALVVREPAAPSAGPSAPRDPLAASPAAQLRKLASDRGYSRTRIVEVGIPADASDPREAARAALSGIGRTFGESRPVDVLCCGPPREADDEAATIPLVREFAESMAAPPSTDAHTPPPRSASVILLSAPYGPRVDLPQPQPFDDAAARGQGSGRKAGAAEMSRLAQVLGAEYANKQVRFNAISPGFLETPEFASLLGREPSLTDAWRKATPLGRVGGVEEVKGAAALLASDASRFTTGTTVVVDGGFSLV
ncbi:hypothetical protein DMC30DRAFT_79236 [Rhodotorula diobovata]|uniref:Uncharacterized protein n=1 Tax=Rhodotorula diobovata TaxID=5288 RepID=A0A5C5G2E9_9BASI|nr:hypothetical protein DMC30DRAFT_79236 [Rhodotorula diobovata]